MILGEAFIFVPYNRDRANIFFVVIASCNEYQFYPMQKEEDEGKLTWRLFAENYMAFRFASYIFGEN